MGAVLSICQSNHTVAQTELILSPKTTTIDSMFVNEEQIISLQTTIQKLENDLKQQLDEQDALEQQQNILGLIKQEKNQIEVYFQVDYNKKERPLYAAKRFKQKDAYKNEKQVYEKIKQYFSAQNKLKQLEEFGCLMESSNDDLKEIKFPLGLCTLESFSKQRSEKNIQWGVKELKYIVQRLCQFVIFMAQNKWYHGDIKPQNIILCKNDNQTNKYSIKLIDFGGARDNFKSQSQRTPLFFSSYKRVEKRSPQQISEDLKDLFDKFQSEEERFTSELYTILRTIQYLFTVQSGKEDHYNIFKLPHVESSESNTDIKKKLIETSRYQTKANILKLFSIMKSEMITQNSSQQKELKEFLSILETKFLEGVWDSPQKLQDQFLNDKTIFNASTDENSIIDDNQVVHYSVKQILKLQPKIGNVRYNQCPLELLFLMDSYIQDRKCFKIDEQGQKSNEQELEAEIQKFLSNKNQHLFCLYGPQGIGKTSFLRNFRTQYQKKQQSNNIITISMTKNHVQNHRVFQDYIKQKIQEIGLNNHNQIIVLLDECDDLQQVNINKELDNIINDSMEIDDEQEPEYIYADLIKPFIDHGIQHFKVIAASRQGNFKNFENYTKTQQINEGYVKYELSKFTEAQIQQYITKYNDQVRKRKDYWDDMLFFESEDEYLQAIKTNKILETAKNPLNLRIILQVLPQLHNNVQDKQLVVNSSKKPSKFGSTMVQQSIKGAQKVLNNGQSQVNQKKTHMNLYKTFMKQYFTRKINTLSHKDLSILMAIKPEELQEQQGKAEQDYLIRGVNKLFKFNKIIAKIIFLQHRLPISHKKINKNKQIKQLLEYDNDSQRDEQISLFIECSPLVEATRTYDKLKQSKQHYFEFEYNFIEDCLIVDCLIEDLGTVKGSINKENLKRNLSMNTVKDVFNQNKLQKMKSSILSQRKLSLEQDGSVISLYQNYLQETYPKSYKSYKSIFQHISQVSGKDISENEKAKREFFKNINANSETLFSTIEIDEDKDFNKSSSFKGAFSSIKGKAMEKAGQTLGSRFPMLMDNSQFEQTMNDADEIQTGEDLIDQ